MISRRGIIGVSAAVFAHPTMLRGQPQSPRRVIGWLGIGTLHSGGDFLNAFRRAIAALGLTEGRDFVLETRWAESSNERLSSLAAELVALSPAIIVAEGTRGVEAVAAATSMISIVAPSMGENAAAKLGGRAFSRPSRNVTGIIASPRSMTAKLFEIAVALVPGATRVGILRRGSAY
jgi:putative tryptophan/tyrosine transport system substrate-binding protein